MDRMTGRSGLEQLDDPTLLGRVAGGDRLAFRILWDRHHAGLYRHCARVMNDPSLAEDLVNDVMTEVWRIAGTYAGRAQVGTWMFAILHNKMVSWMRKRRESELPEDAADIFADPRPSPGEVAETGDMARLLRELIGRLGPDHREVLMLTYYQEMPVAEIAFVLGIPENTVKTRLFYARQRLKAMLDGHGIRGVA